MRTAKQEWKFVYQYARKNGAPRWIGFPQYWGAMGECAWKAACASNQNRDPLVRRANLKRGYMMTGPGWPDWQATYCAKCL
jgi:hypothetical protein